MKKLNKEKKKIKNTTPIVGSGIIQLGLLIKAFIGYEVIILIKPINKNIICSIFQKSRYTFLSPKVILTRNVFPYLICYKVSVIILFFRVNIAWSISYFISHIYHLLSLLKCYFRFRIQSKPLCILSHAILKPHVYAQKLENLALKSVKKTCQVHFSRVEARLKKSSHTFCSILLIFSVKNYLYQTISIL